MKIHITAMLVVMLCAGFCGFSRAEWVLLILTCSAVISLEMVNTAIELLTDKISPEYSKLAKAVKDIAAGAVLVAAFAAAAIGVILFWGRI
jgi:diacylglycerol kinase